MLTLPNTLPNKLKPKLNSLDTEVRTIAVELCLAYQTLEFFREDPAIGQQKKQFRKASLDTVGGLKRLNKSLIALKSRVESLCDPIRKGHTPMTIYDLIPSAGPSTPPVAYFRRHPARDPAQAYLDFTEAISSMQDLVDHEIAYIRKQILEIKKAWKYPVNPFWTKGCLEYTLMRLFKERSRGKITTGKAQNVIAEILVLLDRGGHTPDGVRIAEKRIRTLPKHKIVRMACDCFLDLRYESSRRK